MLLADDHRASRLAARRILKRAGYQVAEVTSGHDVVERVGREPFDLVLMDVAMPGLDGPSAARRVRELAPPAGKVPIVALSGYVGEEERERCRAASMNAFVSKPYRMQDLLEAIASALGGGTPPPAPTEGDAASSSAGFSRREFAVSVREDVDALERAVAVRDRETLRRLAHGLAGAAAIWGLDSVLEPARELDRLAAEAPFDDLVRLVASLRAALV